MADTTAMTTTTNSSRRRETNPLTAFHLRRGVATGTINFLTFEQGFLLGSSVVAGFLLKAFTPGTLDKFPYFTKDGSGFEFHGLYAISMSIFTAYCGGALIVHPLLQKYPESRNLISVILIMMFPLGFFLAGAAVSANQSVPLVYIAFGGVLGGSLMVFDIITRMEILQWWSPDGKKRIGVTLVGLTGGIASVFFTLISGWLISYGSGKICLYTLGGFTFILSAWGSYSIFTGHLDSPPSVDDIQNWTQQAKSSDCDEEKPIDVPEQPKAATPEQTKPAEEVDAETCKTEQESSASTSGTTHLVPVVLQSMAQAFQYPVIYYIIVYNCLTTFNGYATKVLLSSMFELVFALPVMTAAYLSALSLLLFVAARAAIPYYFMDTKYTPIFLCGVSAFLSGIGYCVLPSIVGTEAILEAKYSWRLFGFVLAKSLVGGTFASLQSMTSSVIVDLIGPKNIPVVFKVGWTFASISSFLGPVVSFIITMSRFYDGQTYAEAFHLFFYVAAGIAFLNMLVFARLHRMLYSRQSRL